MNWLRFANVMNTKTIINTFNSDSSNIYKTRTQHLQILKLNQPTNNTFFSIITYSKISFLAYINSIVIQHLSDELIKIEKTNLHQVQKYCHQSNMSFACL